VEEKRTLTTGQEISQLLMVYRHVLKRSNSRIVYCLRKFLPFLRETTRTERYLLSCCSLGSYIRRTRGDEQMSYFPLKDKF